MMIRAMVDRIENGYPRRAAFGALAGAGMGVGAGLIWIGVTEVPSEPALLTIAGSLFALIGALVFAGSRELRPRTPDQPPNLLRDLRRTPSQAARKRPRIIE